MEKPKEPWQPLKDENVLKNAPSRFTAGSELLHGGAEYVYSKEDSVMPRLEPTKEQINVIKSIEELGIKKGDAVNVHTEKYSPYSHLETINRGQKKDNANPDAPAKIFEGGFSEFTGDYVKITNPRLSTESDEYIAEDIYIPIENITNIERHE